MLLQDKVALITGAAGGIGRALCTTMAAAGANVMATDRSREKLDAIVAELTAANPNGKFADMTATLGDTADANALVNETVAKFGRIDILINCAGITADTLLLRMSDEQFDNVINVNLRAAFQLCRAAIMPMMKNRFGRIINLASIIGQIGGPGQANYAASKGGIIAMTKSIAAEVASRGITANCIAPGFVRTPMTDVLPDETKKLYLAQIPMGRFAEPADIANAALFLASDMASYITGQTIPVNGGMGRF